MQPESSFAVLGEGNADDDDHRDGQYSGHGYPVARTLVRASTAPAPQVSQTLDYTPPSPHPRVLTPGFHNVKPGVYAAELFFTSPTSPMHFDQVFSSGPSSPDVPYKSHPYAQPNPPSPSPPPVPPHPHHLRRALTSPPPIPPKSSLTSRLPPSIALYPHVISHPVSAPVTFPVPERNTLPALLEAPERTLAPPASVDDLEIDIPTSRSESGEQQELLHQEEEDLARALKESIISAASPRFVQVSLSNQDIAGPDSQPSASTSAIEPNGSVTDEWRRRSSYSAAQIAEDEAFARRLAEEMNEQGKNTDPQVASSSTNTPLGSISSSRTVQLDDDAAFARKLALEEEDGYTAANDGAVQTSPLPSGPTELPRYIDVVAGTSSTPIVVGGKGGGLALPLSDLIRSNSSSSSASITSGSDTQSLSGRSISSAPYLHPQRRPLSASLSTRPLSSTSLDQLEEEAEDDSSPPMPRSANQFIDADLLLGVSVGFVAPSISSQLLPMQGPMPNIISLPFGRCPPLHLQGPNWRHLLRLMARLSGTRIEPTVEAMAVSKSELKLRTVVQFIRPHHLSPEWRAVVWMTIDHPVPVSMPGAYKYNNGDVNTLPWSYTLSSIPAVLRDGADTPMSKCYTIPLTDSLPYPTLPISFPNMAMYLQAALEESRRHMHDSSSGMRKLAKMVDTCYPTAYIDDLDDSPLEKTGIFKRLIGRGAKNNKKGRGGNEDTYELVTPFVPDEWG